MTYIDKPAQHENTLQSQGMEIYVSVIAHSFLTGVEIDFQVHGTNDRFDINIALLISSEAGICETCGGGADGDNG